MRATRSTLAGWALAALSVVIIGVELVRYWLIDHPIHPMPVGIGAVAGFLGFYLLDSTRAKDASAFIVTNAVTILGALPFGRRWTDKVAAAAAAAPAETTVVVVPGVTTEPSDGDDAGPPIHGAG